MDDTKIDNAGLETDESPDIVPRETQPKKTRGRPSKNGSTASNQKGKKEKLSARQLTGIIYLGNSAAASALKMPELEMQESEAAAIADAVVDVLQYYDFEASAKTVAWANLIGTVATVYGLKIWSIMQRPKTDDFTSD